MIVVFLVITFLVAGLLGWLKLTLIVGVEKPNPYAAIRSQPSFSLTNLVAAVDTPELSTTDIEAFNGALLKPYRHLATSDLIMRS